MNPFTLLIWTALASLAYLSVSWITYRAVLFWEMREANLSTLQEWLGECRVQPQLPFPRREVGWVSRLLRDAPDHGWQDRARFLLSCEALKRQAQTYDGMLPMAQDAAPTLGLLGTVFGLMGKVVGIDNPTALVGLALGTTAAGLGIALAVVISQAVFAKLEIRLVHQIDLVIDEVGRSLSKTEHASKPAGRLAAELNGASTVSPKARASRASVNGKTK